MVMKILFLFVFLFTAEVFPVGKGVDLTHVLNSRMEVSKWREGWSLPERAASRLLSIYQGCKTPEEVTLSYQDIKQANPFQLKKLVDGPFQELLKSNEAMVEDDGSTVKENDELVTIIYTELVKVLKSHSGKVGWKNPLDR